MLRLYYSLSRTLTSSHCRSLSPARLSLQPLSLPATALAPCTCSCSHPPSPARLHLLFLTFSHWLWLRSPSCSSSPALVPCIHSRLSEGDLPCRYLSHLVFPCPSFAPCSSPLLSTPPFLLARARLFTFDCARLCLFVPMQAFCSPIPCVFAFICGRLWSFASFAIVCDLALQASVHLNRLS